MNYQQIYDKLKPEAKQHLERCNAGFADVLNKEGNELFIICTGCGHCVDILNFDMDNEAKSLIERIDAETIDGTGIPCKEKCAIELSKLLCDIKLFLQQTTFGIN